MKTIQLFLAQSSFWKNVLPEVLATVLIAVIWADRFNNLPLPFLLFFSGSILLRLVWNCAIAIHGLGHTIFIAIVDGQLNALNLNNFLENRTFVEIWRSLLPFGSIFIPGCDRVCPWIAAGNPTSWRIKIKAMGGICANFLAILILWQLFPNGLGQFWTKDSSLATLITTFLSQTFFSTNLLIIVSSWSDIAASVTGKAEIFNCGVAGLIALLDMEKDPNKPIPTYLMEILFKILKETEPRGIQAAGTYAMAKDRDNQNCFVGKKKVIPKRDDEPTISLLNDFQKKIFWATLRGIKPKRILNLIAHYRLSTSNSPQNELETHPHEGWTGSRKEYIWENKKGTWKREYKNVSNLIAHNGDFDGVMQFGGFRTIEELGLWLNRILHTNNCTKSDSPKLAGLVDLNRTKGSWYASVRLAWQLEIVTSFKSAFGGGKVAADASNTAPSAETIKRLAAIFDKCFDKFDKPSSDRPDSHYLNQLKEKILLAIANDRTMKKQSLERRAAFVATTIKVFFSMIY